MKRAHCPCCVHFQGKLMVALDTQCCMQTVRQDPDLGNVRASPGFLSLVNKYDEPFINENAVNALKSVFGLFGKK